MRHWWQKLVGRKGKSRPEGKKSEDDGEGGLPAAHRPRAGGGMPNGGRLPLRWNGGREAERQPYFCACGPGAHPSPAPSAGAEPSFFCGPLFKIAEVRARLRFRLLLTRSHQRSSLSTCAPASTRACGRRWRTASMLSCCGDAELSFYFYFGTHIARTEDGAWVADSHHSRVRSILPGERRRSESSSIRSTLSHRPQAAFQTPPPNRAESSG